jgi:hypothetical protein
MVFGSFNLNSEPPQIKRNLNEYVNLTYTAGDNLKPNAKVVNVWGQTFNDDGTKFYIVQNGTSNSNTFTLSQPYDLTSVTSAVAFTAASSAGANWNSVSFRPDYRYYAGGTSLGAIRIYTCATRAAITASDTFLTSIAVGSAPQSMGVLHGVSWTGQDYIFAIDADSVIGRFQFNPAANTITYTGQKVDFGTNANQRSITVNISGTQIFVTNNQGATKEMYTIYLKIPYNLTSYSLAYGFINLGPLITDEPASFLLTEVSFNPDMTRVYIGDFSTSTANSRVYQLRVK